MREVKIKHAYPANGTPTTASYFLHGTRLKLTAPIDRGSQLLPSLEYPLSNFGVIVQGKDTIVFSGDSCVLSYMRVARTKRDEQNHRHCHRNQSSGNLHDAQLLTKVCSTKRLQATMPQLVGLKSCVRLVPPNVECTHGGGGGMSRQLEPVTTPKPFRASRQTASAYGTTIEYTITTLGTKI